MPYDPARHHRRSIRLKGWDYAGAGAYFVTICTHQRQALFGEIVEGEIRLNEFGRIAADEWQRSAVIRAEITLDEWVVMPNHLHGLVIVQPAVGAQRAAPLPVPPDDDVPVHDDGAAPVPAPNVAPGSLGAVVRAFKSAVTKRLNEIRQTPAAPVWQRNYYEHIVRHDGELNAIRVYIRNNPFKWALDRDNAGNTRRLPVPASAADYLADLD
jgi:REP element-mobilizing transposase RayT